MKTCFCQKMWKEKIPCALPLCARNFRIASLQPTYNGISNGLNLAPSWLKSGKIWLMLVVHSRFAGILSIPGGTGLEPHA